MAKPTREQRKILEQKLEDVRRRERQGGEAKKPVSYGIARTELHRVLEKASQPIKPPESDSE